MLKIIFCSFCLLAFAYPCFAQSSVFVLVDVSGSGLYDAKMQAKMIVQDILTGKFDTSKYSPQWRWSTIPFKPPFDQKRGTTHPLLDINNEAYLMIMPVGERNRYQDYKIDDIKNYPADIEGFIKNYYPTSFLDAYTYLDIAKAKAAGVARNSNIPSYFLIEVSDGLNDTNSKALPYTPDEQQLLDQYETDKARPDPLAIFHYFQGNASIFRIKFSIVQVEGTKIPKTPGSATNTPSSKPEITLLRPKGTQKKPTEVNPGAVSIAWQCIGCDTNTLFSVDVVNIKDNKIKFPTKKTPNFGESFSVKEAGIYRVTVKSDKASSRTAYFEVKGESGGGGWAMLVIPLILGLLYLFWKRNRDRDLAENSKPPDDGISQTYQPYKPTYAKKQEESQAPGDDF